MVLAGALVLGLREPSSARLRDVVALVALVGLVASGVIGVIIGAFRHRPTDVARRFVHRLPTKWQSPFETIEPELADLDASSLIRVKDGAHVEPLRAQLISCIFKDHALPAHLPAATADAAHDPWIQGRLRYASATRLTIEMEHGVASHAYLLRPREEKGVVVVHHEGHDLDPMPGFQSIQTFLDAGFPVLALWMPLCEPNPQPVTDVPGIGPWRLRGHDHFRFLESPAFSPLKFFIEPVVVALNYAEELGYERFAMVGVSGGAWTTTVTAALDSRIARSYPVGGGVPLAYWNEPDGNFGDYEAHHPELFRIADYIDMYVLGAFGKGRRQLLIMNKYDPSCFSGSHPRLYGDAVRERVAQLGAGSFDLLLDDTHSQHALSAHARGLVFQELEALDRSSARQDETSTVDPIPGGHADVVT